VVHAGAKELYEVLIRDVTEVKRIDLLVKESAPGLLALNLNQAPALVWKDGLEAVAVAGAVPALCRLLVQQEQQIPAVAAAARRVADSWPTLQGRFLAERPRISRGGALMLEGRQLRLVADAVESSYDYPALEQDLRFELDKRLDAISGPDSLRNITFRVLDRAEREGWLLGLLTMFRQGRYPEVRDVATRVLDQCAGSTGAVGDGSGSGPPEAAADGTAPGGPEVADPFLSYVVGQQPFIDRTVLREHLRDLLSASPSRVLVINGDRPCGKSYTWYYVRQPELLGDSIPVLVDLSEWADPARPAEVMSSIALQLGLPEPTVDRHAQSAAQVQSLRDWFVGKLQQDDRAGQRWLLMVDSLDHVAQRDDTLQLVEFLAGAAIRQRLAGLRVILLGYSNRIPIDPLDSVLTEEIGDIGPAELCDFFRSLARQSNLAISDDAIEVAADSVLRLLPAERDRKLRLLPGTVRNVGNAAFGRRVLP
jgi:hypothetical protein